MAAGFTNVGLSHMVSTEWCGGTPVSTWFIGLIDNSPTPVFSSSDTLAIHTGWAEVPPASGYSGNRPAWGNGAVAGQATTNASTVNFAMLGTFTVYGLHVCSVASGTGGILGATATFAGGTQLVNSGNTLQTTMTISAVSG